MTALPLSVAGLVLAAPAAQAAAPQRQWVTVADNGYLAPGSTKNFNSYNQPSVNSSGVVAFRARTQGPNKPTRGIYIRDTQAAGSTVTPVADVNTEVPQPNNLASTFNEFPSFPRIGVTGSVVATRGQSGPVWEYTLDGADTRLGTSGVYATVGGTLTTGASLLGVVPGYDYYAVPGAPAGTRFDQFPGAPSVDGNTIVFKGNYTDGTAAMTGVYFRDLSQPNSAVQLVANSATAIPNQPAGGTTVFGATAPPSAAGGRTVFVGWDNEDTPTMGGVYLADLTPSPALQTLASIGQQVPGQAAGESFTNFGEGLSFDGRFVGFWGSWGTETRDVTLTCPPDGNADLVAYCQQQYPNGYTVAVPVHQGVFVYDTTSGQLYPVTTTGARFSSFQYWVFSGSPRGRRQ